MLRKSKKVKTTGQGLAAVGQQAGIMLMTLAATIGMLELPDHPNSRIITPSQPTFAFAVENGEDNNTMNREREETAPHFISFSVVQRTPSRAGKY